MNEILNSQTQEGQKGIQTHLGGTPTEEQKVLYRMGKVFYDKADFKEAETLFLKALMTTEEFFDFNTQIKIYGFLIRIYLERKEAEKAERFVKESEKIIEKRISAMNSLDSEYFFQTATIKTFKGDLLAAKENLEIAERRAVDEKNNEVLCKTLYALATYHFQEKNLEKSLEYVKELKDVLQVTPKNYLKGTMHILMGNIYAEKEDFEKALREYQLSIKMLQSKKCWNLYGYILLYQGLIYKRMEKFTESLIYFEQAQALVDGSDFKRLWEMLNAQVQDVTDTSVDIHLDRHNRVVYEKNIGRVDFKHRFVLLEILFLLARQPGVYFDKESLAKLIWKNEYNPMIHDKLIYTSVSRLRKLIEKDENSRQYILREKDGYTFNPKVTARFHNDNGFGSYNIGNVELGIPV
ncbi:MAG: tetratricopeptide repeat protein [Bacteriovoracaceae bacterium]|nr:tetratricopeptide repeat protein [Bacteriovoracaceae bacterium]